MGGTAGSQKRARLLRRAAAGSSPKALLAAAVASGILLMRVAQTLLTETAVETEITSGEAFSFLRGEDNPKVVMGHFVEKGSSRIRGQFTLHFGRMTMSQIGVYDAGD